jgi:hypothetical protein
VGRALGGCLRSGGGGCGVALGVEGGEVGFGGRDGLGEGSCEGAVTVDLDRNESIKALPCLRRGDALKVGEFALVEEALHRVGVAEECVAEGVEGADESLTVVEEYAVLVHCCHVAVVGSNGVAEEGSYLCLEESLPVAQAEDEGAFPCGRYRRLEDRGAKGRDCSPVGGWPDIYIVYIYILIS